MLQAQRLEIPVSTFLIKHRWLRIGFASAGLAFILVISLVGAGFFARFNTAFFIIQTGAILYGFISFLHPHSFTSVDTDSGIESRFRARFPHHLSENLGSNYAKSSVCGDEVCGFHHVFAIAFPVRVKATIVYLLTLVT